MSQPIAEWDAQELHRQLISRAHRILRSIDMAEDVVQEAYVRYLRDQSQGQGDEIQNPIAWLNVAVRNLAYDALRKLDTERRYARKQVTGPQLDDVNIEDSPFDVFARRSACRAMILRLLGVSSVRDVAFVLLREVFDTSYRDLAQASGRAEPACRQAVRRTLQRAYATEAPLKPAVIQSDPLIDARVGLFEQAIHEGDVAPLLDHLRVSASIVDLPTLATARARWLPINQSGTLVFHLFVGPIGLCSSDIIPVLLAPSDTGD